MGSVEGLRDLSPLGEKGKRHGIQFGMVGMIGRREKGVGEIPGRGAATRWGHCLFEGWYPLPNYRPCFSALSAPQSFFTAPYF